MSHRGHSEMNTTATKPVSTNDRSALIRPLALIGGSLVRRRRKDSGPKPFAVRMLRNGPAPSP
jgi:hypothetical protein